MTLRKITLYAPHTEFSGTTNVFNSLAKEFANLGHETHLLRAHREWAIIPESKNPVLITLSSTRVAKLVDSQKSFRAKMLLLALAVVPSLVAYLRHYRPDVIVMGLLTVPGVWAAKLARVPTKSIVSIQGLPRPNRLHHPKILRYSYLQADAIIADCDSIADYIAETSGIDRARIRAVHNPVLDGTETAKMLESLDHPWFHDNGPPVILGVGRLLPQKDFLTLLRAFALVRASRPARLVIFGEGTERPLLENLIVDLGIQADVSLPGSVKNPFKYMAKADVFVLSSLWEGPGHVVIEALSAGAPIVATDCPVGPREVLLDGKAGLLVPTRDPQSMADAILAVLDDPISATERVDMGRSSLDRFYAQRVAKEYLDIIETFSQR